MDNCIHLIEFISSKYLLEHFFTLIYFKLFNIIFIVTKKTVLKSICTLHTVMFLTGANDEGNCFCNIVLGGPIEKIAKTNDSHSFQIDTLKFFFL